jgi:hypothetical protein
MQTTEKENYKLTYDKRTVTQESIELFKYVLQAFQSIQLSSNEKELASTNSESNSLVDYDLVQAYVKELSKLNVGDQIIGKITRPYMIPNGRETSARQSLEYMQLLEYIFCISGQFIPKATDISYSTSHSGYLKDREEAIEQEIK